MYCMITCHVEQISCRFLGYSVFCYFLLLIGSNVMSCFLRMRSPWSMQTMCKTMQSNAILITVSLCMSDFRYKIQNQLLKNPKAPSVIILALHKQKLKYLCSSVGIAFHRVSGARFWREKQLRPISWGEFPYLHTSAPF